MSKSVSLSNVQANLTPEEEVEFNKWWDKMDAEIEAEKEDLGLFDRLYALGIPFDSPCARCLVTRQPGCDKINEGCARLHETFGS